MKNIDLKKIFALLSLVILAGGFYFYQKNDSFAKKERCATVGNSYSKEELRDRNYSDGRASNSTGNPQFAYNGKYNSCFYLNNSDFVLGTEVMKTEYYIINLTTNEKVASYVRWDKGYDDYLNNEVYIKDKKDFDLLRKEVFGY